MLGGLRQTGHTTQHFAGAERNLHTAAHIDLAHEPVRDEIIELLSEGDLECDAGDHANRESKVNLRVSSAACLRGSLASH